MMQKNRAWVVSPGLPVMTTTSPSTTTSRLCKSNSCGTTTTTTSTAGIGRTTTTTWEETTITTSNPKPCKTPTREESTYTTSPEPCPFRSCRCRQKRSHCCGRRCRRATTTTTTSPRPCIKCHLPVYLGQRMAQVETTTGSTVTSSTIDITVTSSTSGSTATSSTTSSTVTSSTSGSTTTSSTTCSTATSSSTTTASNSTQTTTGSNNTQPTTTSMSSTTGYSTTQRLVNRKMPTPPVRKPALSSTGNSKESEYTASFNESSTDYSFDPTSEDNTETSGYDMATSYADEKASIEDHPGNKDQQASLVINDKFLKNVRL